jgi:hypothetical protein
LRSLGIQTLLKRARFLKILDEVPGELIIAPECNVDDGREQELAANGTPPGASIRA